MPKFQLSDREIEICKEFIKSKGCKDCISKIAQSLVLGTCTVKTHLANIFKELKINTKAELMYKLLRTTTWKQPKWRIIEPNKRKKKEKSND